MDRLISTQFGTITTAVAVRLGGIADVRLAARVDCALALLRLYLSGCAERLGQFAPAVVKNHLRKALAGRSATAVRANPGVTMPWPVTWGRPALLPVSASSR